MTQFNKYLLLGCIACGLLLSLGFVSGLSALARPSQKIIAAVSKYSDTQYSIMKTNQFTLPIEQGDQWAYFKGISEPPADWTHVDFDDSGWLVGESGVGYGDDDDTTILEDMLDNYISVYARHEFFVEDPSQLDLLMLSIDYDDGFAAYINGTEVWRENISGYPPEHDTPADSDHEAGSFERMLITPTLLITDVNVLAIQGHNVVISSTDFSLIPKLGEKQLTPLLQNVFTDSINILWETGNLAESKVRYRENGEPSWIEVSNQKQENIHDVRISDLLTDTLYQYQVSMDGQYEWGNITPTLKTAPSSQQRFRMVVYGDSRTNYFKHSDVVDQIVSHGPDIVLHTGDFVEFGDIKNEWYEQLFYPAADLLSNTPFYPTLGDHDYATENTMWYYEYFSLPQNERWYAFSYGCGRFISLDTNITDDFATGSPQYNWLIDEMNSNEYKNSKWQAVFFHHPPYTSGNHIPDLQVQEYLVPLFEQFDIDLVLSGHNHNYERSYKNDIYYIITGGGGASLYGFPNLYLNPYSQVRVKSYHFTSLDFDCSQESLELNTWEINGDRIDGPVSIKPDSTQIFFPLIFKN
jgi:3',5'-cyclic AMP phosphodiesterase CpdA